MLWPIIPRFASSGSLSPWQTRLEQFPHTIKYVMATMGCDSHSSSWIGGILPAAYFYIRDDAL